MSVSCTLSRDLAEVYVDTHVPFIQQPFGNVYAISIELAPPSQLNGGNELGFGQSQASDFYLELGSQYMDGFQTKPTRIAVPPFPGRQIESLHGPRSYTCKIDEPLKRSFAQVAFSASALPVTSRSPLAAGSVPSLRDVEGNTTTASL